MKNNVDTLVFHTTICAEASQIALMHRAKTATLLFARTSSAKLRNGDYYEPKYRLNYLYNG